MNLSFTNMLPSTNLDECIDESSNSSMLWSHSHMYLPPRADVPDEDSELTRVLASNTTSRTLPMNMNASNSMWVPSTLPIGDTEIRKNMHAFTSPHLPLGVEISGKKSSVTSSPLSIQTSTQSDSETKWFDPDMFFSSTSQSNQNDDMHSLSPAPTPSMFMKSPSSAVARSTMAIESFGFGPNYQHQQPQQPQQQQQQQEPQQQQPQFVQHPNHDIQHKMKQQLLQEQLVSRNIPLSESQFKHMLDSPTNQSAITPMPVQIQQVPSSGRYFDEADVASVVTDKRGSSCHQCKRKQSHSKLVFCTNMFDKKHSLDKRLCRKKYCFNCLAKFYAITDREAMASSDWQCPSCTLVCTCAACMRKRGEIPFAMHELNQDYERQSPNVPMNVSIMGLGH